MRFWQNRPARRSQHPGFHADIAVFYKVDSGRFRDVLLIQRFIWAGLSDFSINGDRVTPRKSARQIPVCREPPAAALSSATWHHQVLPMDLPTPPS